MIVISISLLLLTVAFARSNKDEMSATNRYLALAGIFGVAIGYAGSFGPLTWLLVSELIPEMQVNYLIVRVYFIDIGRDTYVT